MILQAMRLLHSHDAMAILAAVSIHKIFLDAKREEEILLGGSLDGRYFRIRGLCESSQSSRNREHRPESTVDQRCSTHLISRARLLLLDPQQKVFEDAEKILNRERELGSSTKAN